MIFSIFFFFSFLFLSPHIFSISFSYNSLDLCSSIGSNSIYTESINFQSSKRIISSNSCPNHYSICQTKECSGIQSILSFKQDFYYEIPLYPILAKDTTDLTCQNGTIGIALNGVSIQSMSHDKMKCVSPEIGGQSKGDKACNIQGILDGTKVCGDAVQSDYQTFDKCGGHTDEFGVYHYHIPPTCLIQQLTSSSPSPSPASSSFLPLPSPHSPQIGWALDGFPIYGPIGPLGGKILPCSHPLADNVYCLDECNGLSLPLYDIDSYAYRYYITGPIGDGICHETIKVGENGELGKCDRIEGKCCISEIPSPLFSPYTLGCYRGCRIDQLNDGDCLAGSSSGVLDNFYPEVAISPTGIFKERVVEAPPSDPPSSNNVSTSQNASVPSPAHPYRGYGSTAVRYNRATRSVGRIHVSPLPGQALNEVTVEEFDQGGDQAFITGMAVREGNSERRILYTTQHGIFSMKEDGLDLTPIVTSITSLSLSGYSLGRSLHDIEAFTVYSLPCSNVFYENNQRIRCLHTSLSRQIVQTLDSDQVSISISHIRLQGVHLQPLTVARSESRRPVISAIDITSVPFVPYSVALPIKRDSGSNDNDSIFVYWSEISSGKIYRNGWSGENIQLILEEVDRVYGLAVIESNSEETSEHTIYFTDAAQGILGRISVSTQVSPSPTFTALTSLQAPSSAVLLKDLPEPRGLAVDLRRGLIYLTTYYGYILTVKLSEAQSILTTYSISPSFSSLPRWITVIHRSMSFSRYDGIAVLPFPLGSFSVPSWKELPIVVMDLTQNVALFLSTDGFTSSSLSLSNGFSVSSVIWPRSVSSPLIWSRAMEKKWSIIVGEMFGKIWNVQIDLTLLHQQALPTSVISRPEILYDSSNYAASNELRSEYSRTKYSVNRTELLFIDLLD